MAPTTALALGAMEDPAKILDQSVADMQADLVKLRQAVATAIASQKRIQNQPEQAEAQANTWYERAELALKKGEEDLAREALGRRKTCQDTATALNTQLQSQAGQVEQLKRSLVQLESKIAEAKTKKDMLKARAQAAQAQEQLQSAVGSLGTNSAMAAFEQMEEKVQALEARSQAAAELAGADLESQFAALEGAPEVDAELEALKGKLSGAAPTAALPAAWLRASRACTFSSICSKAAMAELVPRLPTALCSCSWAWAAWALALSMSFLVFASAILLSSCTRLRLSCSTWPAWLCSWPFRAVAVSWQVLRRPRASRARSSSPFLRASSARSYQVADWVSACSAWF